MQSYFSKVLSFSRNLSRKKIWLKMAKGPFSHKAFVIKQIL